MLIRKAVDQDFDAIWEIFHNVVKSGDTYAYHPETTKDEAYQFWMPPHRQTYVAEMNNKIVGTYYLRENQPGLGAHVANAAYMVHPQFHGHGIGSAMALHSFAEAKQQGFKAMQFNLVVSSNTPAVQLWKKMGFSIIGTTPQGFKHSQKGFIDTYVMHKML